MCSMVHSVPLYTAATYRYVVQVDTGVRYLTNSIIIERPRGLRTSCPQYVREGGDLNCTCIVDIPGNPPGYASWDRWRTTLLETGVQRRHDGAVTDVCRLYWLSSVGILPLKEQITYTLRVAYPPELPPVIEGIQNDESVRSGDRLILTCKVSGGRPLVSSVNFTCGHHEDEEDSVSGSFVSSVVTLDPVTAKDDGIRCRCSAKWLPEITQYSQTEEVVLNVINDADDAPGPCTLSVAIASSVVAIIYSLVLVAVCARLARSGKKSAVYERPCPGGDSAGLFDYSTYTSRTQQVSSTQDMEPIYEEVRDQLYVSPQKSRDEAAVENKLPSIPQYRNEAIESCEASDVKMAANFKSDYLHPL
ncbi:uncharacterized protein LOC112569250 isoform X1 [Pomacea canaliculata]|uniref:uncharacterized protein LOC112569250 isoform X1 n=1 Tax=Pomacea canaliculata TaxID=400727 RepID=UPI000D72F585|nr:uncharacterized protein LOC112569250 isoform X1 [Pomacea canaliculata]